MNSRIFDAIEDLFVDSEFRSSFLRIIGTAVKAYLRNLGVGRDDLFSEFLVFLGIPNLPETLLENIAKALPSQEFPIGLHEHGAALDDLP